MDAGLEGFDCSTFAHDGYERDVYAGGTGPAVIVIHEMPGLHPGVVDFARRVVARGYHVRMPSLFGTPGRPYSGGSYCHGHGYDILQRPIARAEETLTFGPDMNIGVHPMYLWEGNFIWVNSNFLTSETGPEPVRNYPAELTAR